MKNAKVISIVRLEKYIIDAQIFVIVVGKFSY